MIHWLAVASLYAIFCLADASAQEKDSTLSIIDAGIQSSEDAPFISKSFRFQPGDFVYATFQISNFARKQQTAETLPTIALKYSATLMDAKGLPLAPPETGTIESELSAEDKNWVPKRRVSFTLPPFLAAGTAQVVITVKDVLAGSETTRSLPLTIGGVVVVPSDTVSVQNLQFVRREADTEPLDVPAFTPGDAVFIRFNLTGFKTDAKNTYRVAYDLLVLRPDGKPYIEQPLAAQLSADSFYPAQFLPGLLQLTTSPTSSKGTYPVIVTIHDLIANKTVQTKTAFQLE